ncbi:hypothetical protein [Nissabacter sp. SGAir0207]|uniref:hypothetical protein n=1 Tax=Nissabacter sp. SGAir0207 TaxID=2126321 RepID=UPI0010CD4281|nr:hypothetical protein [Nissabacter sp. SGAir0207]QCR38738.1 hypothetical protein C1N62_21635 [Nissabacter sp. SGAir0207]
MSNKEYQQHIADIASRARRVTRIVSDAQFNKGGFIQNAEERRVAMLEAAKQEPIFEGVNPSAVSQIVTAWGAAYADYAAKHKTAPREDLLAMCHQTLENCLMAESRNAGGQKTINQSMLESVNAEMMSGQDGILHQAIFLAMILPVALGAQTGDACTFIPVPRDESNIYEIFNVAGTTFGDYAIGDKLDMQSVGAYSQMRRNYVLSALGDGTTKVFTFKISDFEGKDIPIRKGRTVLYIGNEPTPEDNGEGTLLHSYADASGTAVSLTSSLDYTKGQITLTFSMAPASGTKLEAEVEINIEAAPELIPLINQEMKKYTVRPSQYALAAEHTVMAAYDAQREFGIDLGSLQYRTLKDYLSHEQDMLRLRIMIRRTMKTDTFDLAIPQDTNWDVWSLIFKSKMQQIYRDIAERTQSSGSSGMFAGSDAALFFKMLPPSMFTPAENYTQVPFVHFVGTLFGSIKVYEVPTGVCNAFTKQGVTFGSYDVLCYCRDENPGKAGFVTGDAVPAIPFVHPTTPGLRNRTTLWGSAINRIHPRNGSQYFTLLTLTNAKKGGINFRTGQIIESASS